MRVHSRDSQMSELSESPRPKPQQEEEEEQEEEELDDESGLDKTIADSFPASDPPSSIPDPDEEDETRPKVAD